MATVTRSGISNLLELGLRAVFFNQIKQYEKMYDKVLNVEDSQKQTEYDLEVVGTSAWDPVNEGIGTGYESIEEGWKTTYTHVTFRKGIRCTAEAIEDELYGVLKKSAVSLARGAWQRVETDAADLFNNAFSTTAPRGSTMADSVALISSSHTLKTGGTAQSNALAAAADLSPSSLQEAIKVLETAKDEKGIQLYMPATKLVVPTALKFTAEELTGSEYKPGTSDNEINAIKSQGLTYVANPFLTDEDAWFLLSDQHQLNFLWRVKPTFFKANDVDTQDFKCIGRMRYSLGASSWRGITGSAGA